MKDRKVEKMKSYKEYDREFIGDSDIAALIFVGTTKNGLEAKILDFGCDGRYNAYIVDENAKIGDHYSLEMEYETSSGFKAWLKVYDDEGLTADYTADKIKVYRAGDFGCIIQLIGKKE